MSNQPTAKDVAEFMKAQLDQKKELYQEDVVYEIQIKFGSDFVYENESGNLAINKKVLNEFRKITPNVVWERGEKCWRKRQQYDHSGSRMQD